MAEKLHWIGGIHAVTELLRQRPASVHQVLVQQGREDRRMQEVLELAAIAGIHPQIRPRQDLDRLLSGSHQGILAATVPRDAVMDEAGLVQLLNKLDHDPLLLVLDEITDPHNLGACLRTADAAGVDAVILPKDKSAPLNATVHKVASGAAESVAVVRVTNLARTLEQLKQKGIWLVGTADGASTPIYDQQLTGPIAIVVGSEGKGMRRLTREACDFLVSLPMAGAVSSLNVSVATGVALFEAVRQRRN